MLNNLDGPSQECSELWVKTVWMAHSISATATPEFRRKPDFLEISLSLCFFPFEWLVIALLPILEMYNVGWYSWQYAVQAMGPFSTHSNSINQSSLYVQLCWLKSLIRKLRLTSKFMTSQPGLHTIPIHILTNISQSKYNQTMKLGQLIEYNKKNIFLQKLWRKWGRETSSWPLFIF